MELLKKNLANLLKVKTIVTFVVLLVFAVMALRGDFATESVLAIVSGVISFYFCTQNEKKNTTLDNGTEKTDTNA